MSLQEIIERELKKGRVLEFKYYKYATIYLKYDKSTNTFYTESDDPSFVVDGMPTFELADYANGCYIVRFIN